jgi:hypothetical protein
MPLALISPVGSNFIKDFPAQNTVNCDLIDGYAGPYALQSYTPAITAVTTNPVLGATGVITGYFYEIFDQIYSWGEFKFNGAGSNKGAGTYRITLPFKAKSVFAANGSSGRGPIIGSGLAYRASVGSDRQPIVVQLETVTTMMFNIRADTAFGARAVSGTDTPFAWANGDGLKWNVRYQRDPT